MNTDYWKQLLGLDEGRQAQEGLEFVNQQKADANQAYRMSPEQNKEFTPNSNLSLLSGMYKTGVDYANVNPTASTDGMVQQSYGENYSMDLGDNQFEPQLDEEVQRIRSLPKAEIKQIQKELGVVADGDFGPKSQIALSEVIAPQVQSTASNMGAGQTQPAPLAPPTLEEAEMPSPMASTQLEANSNQMVASNLRTKLQELIELKESILAAAKKRQTESVNQYKETGQDEYLSNYRGENLARIIGDLKPNIGDALTKRELGLDGGSSTKFSDEYKLSLKNETNKNKKEALINYNKAVISYNKEKDKVVKGNEDALPTALELYGKARDLQAEALQYNVPVGYLPKLETIESAVQRIKNSSLKEQMIQSNLKLAGAKVGNIDLEQKKLGLEIEAKEDAIEQKKQGTPNERQAAALAKELISYAAAIDKITKREIATAKLTGNWINNPAMLNSANFREAILRDKSGAAIGIQEEAQETDRYSPGVLDSDAVLKEKSKIRANMINRVIAAAGSQYDGGNYTSQFGASNSKSTSGKRKKVVRK